MGFGEAVKSVFGKFAVFSGRARRAEYWYFVLLVLIAEIVLLAIDFGIFGMPILIWFLVVGVIVPGLSVTVRRLHDLDKSGWFYLFVFIPLVGPILLLVWMCTPGTPGPNSFGEDPTR
jgi:uncharacterized membrane protein YhaH (DUF805 family)